MPGYPIGLVHSDKSLTLSRLVSIYVTFKIVPANKSYITRQPESMLFQPCFSKIVSLADLSSGVLN